MRTELGIVGLCLAAAACSPHRVTHDPAPPLTLPAAYADEQARAAAPAPNKWWTEFQDPQLDALVAETLRGNFQLRAAWARVEQAWTLVAQANSGKYPQLQLQAGAAHEKTRFSSGAFSVFNERSPFTLAAGYEVDLWRRIADTADAGTLDALAMRDDVEAIAITLVAEVAEAWFDLIAVSAQVKLLREQLETNQVYLELIELRFQKGLASSLDIYQQRQQLVTTQSQVTVLEGTVALLEGRLAILIGKPVTAISVTPSDALPGLPGPVPGAGIPADLLERRPDVRAARRRVEAADYRVAAAVADRLPNLKLQASASPRSSAIADLFSSPLWSVIAAVTAPILDGGRRKAEVVRNKAVVQERLMQYGHVLLQAMVEVENALASEARQRAYIAELEQLVELAGATLEQAQARYQQGLIDYLPVLSALQGKQRIEIQLLQAQRELLSFRIQLCRALGGTWTRELQAPEPAALESRPKEAS